MENSQPQSIINNSQGSQIYKVVAFISTALLLLLAGAAGFWFYQQKNLKPASSPEPAVTTQPVGQPLSEPSIEPSVLPTIVPSPKPSPSVKTKSDLDAIKEAFSKKYNKPLSDVNITISKNNGIHASGGVKFGGEMGGGWWLAYNDNGNWMIVQDGNGTVTCEIIEPYNFPTDMVPECVTQAGKLIKR